MEKSLFISMSNYDFDGRSVALIRALSTITAVESIILGKGKTRLAFRHQKKGLLSLSHYVAVLKAILVALFDFRPKVVFVDNFTAAPFGVLLSIFYRPKVLVYDMRELYSVDSKQRLLTRLVLHLESLLIKKMADVVIVANKERCEYLRRNISIRGEMVVFENLRFLPCDESVSLDRSFSLDKVSKLIQNCPKGATRFVSTGGYSRERGSLSIVEAFRKFDRSSAVVFFVGGSHEAFKEDTTLSDSNIFFLNKIPYNMLSHLLKLMDVGIVHYSFDDINNELCASGKTYEYVGIGLALLCTEHETLARFCNQSNAGIATSDLKDGIKSVIKNLDLYKSNARAYSKLRTEDEQDTVITRAITRALARKTA